MNDIAIRAENLSKQFHIGAHQKNRNFREALVDGFKTTVRSAGKLLRGKATGNAELDETIWALKDVSFEIRRGETVGIIGGNGAGKSTLLKVLSRITEPTKGFADIHGRMSSLLEVGTGFHHELTGRENIFLNGAILGMKKTVIRQKFDEIVAFSEIERFIDTPVKHYSSGMYLRLAFAVAAHLEPEILLVDEVLAVGDIAFQKKCMGKMSNVAKEGRTVILVSHNMGAITRLCSRALWLEGGCLKLDGPSVDIVSKYMSLDAQETGSWAGSPVEDSSGRLAWLTHARVLSGNENKVMTVVHYDQQIKIEIGYEIKRSIRGFKSYLMLREPSGNIIWASHDIDGTNEIDGVREPGIYRSTCVFPQRMLGPGWYQVSIGIVGKQREAVEEEHLDALSFQVSEAGYVFNIDPRMGLIAPCLVWEIVRQKK